ncbi:MAG TPA: LacI family DNA-binding transcriptional regulator [Rhodothermales bacterium]|nr:LacI family transcriptional regulator [Bacteroidota bacterium]HRK74431.1 LacI family DNA-binding transcriptional regulator [Rhodothermales bacterium]HRR09375.1 LacI family DNA-binding transcriptional regulator [Rhodothermales bacterium]
MSIGKVTIYEVAQHAGVAISTVSRVLNNSPEVSHATRQKVVASIEVLGFRPHRMAKMLAQQNSQTISVATPSFTALFYNEMLKGVKDTIRENGFDLLLTDLSSQNPHETLTRFFQRGSVDALLLALPGLDEKLLYEVRLLNAPVVLIGTRSDEFDSFYWDDAAGAEMAVQHLVEQGHTRIGMLAPHEWSEDAAPRADGYRRALLNAGLPFDPLLIQEGITIKHAGHSEEAGYEAIQALIKNAPDVTAIFAASDVLAIGALAALREMGKQVPEDMAVMGYDDLKISRFLGLSSINQKMFQVGLEAATQVIRRINDPKLPSIQRKIEPELQIRMTTRRK